MLLKRYFDWGHGVRLTQRGFERWFLGVFFAVGLVIGLAVAIAPRMASAEPVLIDVRTAEEFAAGHLEGAINIPLNAADFREQIAALDRESEFILHCGSGARADRVLDFMVDQGFTGVEGSYSLEEARDLLGRDVIGDLDASASANPTTNADAASPGGPPSCALTGELLYGLTRY